MNSTTAESRMSANRVAAVIGSGPWASPAYDSLSRELSRAIGDGRLPVGLRLPSERELAARIGLSRTTTTRAYALLRDRGYVVTRRGSGSVVQLPDVPGGRIDHLLAPAGMAEDEIDLTCTASVAPPGLLGAYERAVAQIHAYLPGTGYYPSGLPMLRELIAQRFSDRGVATDPDQILITQGALGAVAIAAHALLTRPQRVLVESPTYPNAIATLEGAGAKLVTYPLELGSDGHHWDLEAMSQVVRQTGTRLAYLIPDFHNPTGALLPESRRPELGKLLRESGVVPIFDESLVELGLDGQPTPTPMAAYVPDSITAGSLSKICWGGLRVGWMRIPRPRIDAMAAGRLRLDLGAPVLEQLVAVEIMREHDAVVAAQQERLRSGRDELVAQVRTHLPSWQVAVPQGGMALWCRLPMERSGALSVSARTHGLGLVSGPNFAPAGGMDRWIRLPYTVAESQLEQVGPRLAAAWAEAMRSQDSVPRSRARIVA